MAGARGGWTTVDGWLRSHPSAVDGALAAGVAVLLAPASLGLVWSAGWPAAGQVAGSVVIGVAHASVAVRRRSPRGAFAAVCLAMLALVLAPDVDGAAAADLGGGPFAAILLPSALTFPVVLYAVAAHGQRSMQLPALAVALTGASLTAARLWQPGAWLGTTSLTGYRLFLLFALPAAVLAPWSLGRFRSIRTDYVQALEEQARRAEQDRLERAAHAAAAERSRIAREMHDVVAHSLSVVVSQAEGGRLATQRDPAVAGPTFATIASTGRAALVEMRSLLGVLHEDGGEGAEDGHPGASRTSRSPQPGLADLPTLLGRVRSGGTVVRLTERGQPAELGAAGELAAYRVVQESLTNVVKHAGPRAAATVALSWSGRRLQIEVTDDGSLPPQPDLDPAHRADPGPGASAADGSSGRGLLGMRERLRLVGGTLSTTRRAGGFHVVATVPVLSPERST